jgi:hypothetical protein
VPQGQRLAGDDGHHSRIEGIIAYPTVFFPFDEELLLFGLLVLAFALL